MSNTSFSLGKRPNISAGAVVAAVLIGIIVLWVVGKKIKSLFQAWKSHRNVKSSDTVLAAQGIKKTYDDNWYLDQAQKLYAAQSYWFNCDEGATQDILTSLQNDRDYYALVSAFGLKDGWTLQQWVANCLNDSERDSVNQVWSSRDITRRI